MPIDPRTPVLVGVGAVQQRCDDPRAALEPIELMIAALEHAAAAKQVEDIAKQKMPDLNAASIETAVKSVRGTSRSMGIEVVG